MFNSDKYIIENIKLAESMNIKMHMYAVSTNLRYRFDGLDIYDPIDDETLLNLGIRKYTGQQNYTIQLREDELNDKAKKFITDNGKYPLILNQIETEPYMYDFLSFRYYKNLLGEYHKIDYKLLDNNISEKDKYGNRIDGIVIKSLDDGYNYKLTKDMLEEHPYTKEELLLMGNYYNDLLIKYPYHNSLIRGVINPVRDINRLIHSKSGTILTYNEKYIGKNELYLIKELENRIINYLARWNISEYSLVDELYAASLHVSLINFIILNILNIRASKIGTNEVSNFHMNEFFKSNFGLVDYVEFLSDSSKMFLYKHLKYIINNIGKESTLKLIVDNILKDSPVDIFKINLLKNKLNKNDNSIITEDYINIDEEVLSKTDFDNNIYERIPIASIINKELDLINDNKFNNTYITDINRDIIKTLKNSNEDSKILLLEYSKLSNTDMIDKHTVILDMLLYLAYNNYNPDILYTIDKYDKSIKVNNRELALIVLYYIIKSFNNNIEINNYTITTLLDKTLNIDEIIDSSNLDNNIKSEVKILLNKFPNYSNVTYRTFKKYINDINTWYFRLHALYNRLDNKNESLLRDIVNRLTTINIGISNTPKKIIYIIDNQKLIDYVNNIDIDNIVFIYKDILDISYDSIEFAKNILNNYRMLLDKLTSYTTQIISYDIDDILNGYLRRNGSFYGMNVVQIESGTYKCFEDGDIHINSYVSNYISNLNVTSDNKNSIYEIVDDTIHINTLLLNEENIVVINSNVEYNIIEE